MRSFSNDLRSALDVIAAATEQFAMACLDAGADGFVFVTQLAEKDKMRAREYRDFGQQFDLLVLEALKHVPIRILHFDSEHPLFELADRYPVQAVCWATWHSDPSLANARRQTRRTLMGGLNPTTFASGSQVDVQDQVEDAIAQTEGWQILISPSGPLPPDSRAELLSAVYEILRIP